MQWKFKNKVIKTLDDILKIDKDILGFVYYIELDNGTKYIGKKNIFSIRKKHFSKAKLKEITDKRKKTYEMIKKESDWLTYNGSSRKLKADLKNGVKVVKRDILGFATSKQDLTYLETKYLFINDVLYDDKFHNDNILGKFYGKSK